MSIVKELNQSDETKNRLIYNFYLLYWKNEHLNVELSSLGLNLDDSFLGDCFLLNEMQIKISVKYTNIK